MNGARFYEIWIMVSCVNVNTTDGDATTGATPCVRTFRLGLQNFGVNPGQHESFLCYVHRHVGPRSSGGQGFGQRRDV
jgi:hypothetical protein